MKFTKEEIEKAFNEYRNNDYMLDDYMEALIVLMRNSQRKTVTLSGEHLLSVLRYL